MSSSYIYIIRNIDIHRVKIGVSNDIQRRLITLQNAGGCKMELSWVSRRLTNSYFIESLLHDKFNELRYIGEWFNLDVDIAIKSAIILVNKNGKFPISRNKKTRKEPEQKYVHVKELHINNYKRINPGVYADKEGKVYSIKYRIDGTGWDVSELTQL